jgi:hypothetical protein
VFISAERQKLMDAQVAPSLTKLRESTASFTMLPSAFAVRGIYILAANLLLSELLENFAVKAPRQTGGYLKHAVKPERLFNSARLVV